MNSVVLGIALPQWILQTRWFAVLATFVAINTVMYAALSIAKILPKIYVQDYLPRRYERSQTRSIYPDQTPRNALPES